MKALLKGVVPAMYHFSNMNHYFWSSSLKYDSTRQAWIFNGTDGDSLNIEYRSNGDYNIYVRCVAQDE